ncbi:hypothetical protein PINS_up013511 [Pythium insidiosum]|nr:hypothetical protein PINS_up013511 [Pythium insidiosum]
MRIDLLDDLVTATNGALGLHAFLYERRRDLPELVSALSSATVDGTDVVLRLETLPLHVQRCFWGALVRSPSLLPRHIRAERGAALDAVCLALAQSYDDTLEELHVCRDPDEFQPLYDRLQSSSSELDDALTRVAFLPTMMTIVGSSEVAPKRRLEPQPPSVETSDEQVVVKRPRQATEQRQTPELPAEISKELSDLAKQLQSLSAAQSAVDDAARALEQVMNAVHASPSDDEALFRLACARLELSSASDEALLRLTTALMATNWSSRYAAIFLETSVRPKILGATSVISRVLLQTALLFAKPNYLFALLDGLIRRLLIDASIAAPQGEALTRILRECELPVERLDELLLAPALEGRDELPPLRLANETTVLVLQNVLNLKPTLSRATVERLISVCHSAVVSKDSDSSNSESRDIGGALRKSPKFATLVFTLVSKYSAQCVAHGEELRAIAAQLSSVMAKATQRAVAKLQTS